MTRGLQDNGAGESGHAPLVADPLAEVLIPTSETRPAMLLQFCGAEHDPWHISRARFRDKGLRRSISKFVTGKSVLELGCGEGHLTQSIFSETRMFTGVDISDIAIEPAKARNIQNARFEISDFLKISFDRYDVITAIKFLYYLAPESSRLTLP
jgi:2-polyprenyl-3-methyl-5-hydroxy-6-metoxy-1,4-benzoquinol methylase